MTEEEKKAFWTMMMSMPNINIGQVNNGDGYQNCIFNQPPNAHQDYSNFEEAEAVPDTDEIATNGVERDKKVLEYVMRLEGFVVREWKGKWKNLWMSLMKDEEVSKWIDKKNKSPYGNKENIVNIINVLKDNGLFTIGEASQILEALENDKTHALKNYFVCSNQIVVNHIKEVMKKVKEDDR